MSNKYEKTYCNPLSLPDYVYAGKDWAFLKQFLPVTGRWQEGTTEPVLNTPFRPYRTLSDPDVMYHDGKWYMYATSDIVYESSDLLSWKAHPLLPHRFDTEGLTKEGRELSPHEKDIFSIWTAATAQFYRGKFVMMHSSTNCIYASSSPYGPFEKLGELKRPDGSEIWVDDPALFVDDDDRIYLYFGCGIETGIQGVELDGDNLCQLKTEPVRIVEFRPETVWECTGRRHQDTTVGWIEGCDMFKHNGRYYMIYAANGTTYDTYNLGVYYSDNPLTGFKPQKRKGPFAEKLEGVCKGSGHGSVIKGPDDTIWLFYTCISPMTHMYERRIGMDKVLVDENGELYVKPTDYPQWAPGITKADDPDNDTGLLPLNHQNQAWATSASPGRDPIYVGDESTITWWEPDEGDKKPQIIIDLRCDYEVSASRIMWKEIGIDKEKGANPGPVKYKIEVTGDASAKENWVTVVDMSENNKDYLNDYRTFEGVTANKAKLTILDTPENVKIGVISFVVFGKKNSKKAADKTPFSLVLND